VKRYLRPAAYFVAAIWAVFSFLASNNPEEVRARIGAWGAEGYITSTVQNFAAFAGSPFMLAATFFAIGFFVAAKFFRNRSVASLTVFDDDWAYDLGSEMAHLIYEIDRMGWAGNARDVVAQLNVIAVKANEKGLAFPKQAQGFTEVGSFLPYLHQVSAFLKANQVPQARTAAEHYANSKTA
jgi:hypothetical protein